MARVLRVVVIEGQAVLDAGAADEIVAALRGGGLVVYPTDTLYALGADPARPEALARLFAAKQRPAGQPVSVAFPDLDAAKAVAVIPPGAEAAARRWLPGPVTLLFRPAANAPSGIVSSEGTVAVRVPAHPVALMIAKRFGPVTATSANLHGKASPVECGTAREQLGDAVDLYVDAGPCPVGRESTIVDCTGREPKVVRAAGASPRLLQMLREAGARYADGRRI